MADQGKWFKLWCSAGDDPDMANLSLEDFGRWCKLGMYIKLHGTNGTVSIQKPAYSLQQQFRVSSCEEILQILSRFPNCITVSLETNITVSFRNWLKYQGDFSSDRVRKFRQMKRSKRRGEEKRRDETREEEKNTSPPPPSRGNVWPSAGGLIELYNVETADECQRVESISAGRQVKAKQYIAQFPERSWWVETFQATHRSRFLRGHKHSLGHETFRCTFDWLLSKGKDGTENCVKVHDGHYED